jgi:hypothetical protein
MDDNVIDFPNSNSTHQLYEGEDDVHIPVEKLLAGLEGREFSDVIFIGKQSNGVFYFASTSGNIAEINWDLEKAKLVLLQSLNLDLGDDE